MYFRAWGWQLLSHVIQLAIPKWVVTLGYGWIRRWMAAAEDGGKWRLNGSGDGGRQEAAFAAVQWCSQSPRVTLGFRHLPGAAPRQELILLLTELLVALCWKVMALLSRCGKANSSNVGESCGYHGDESPGKSYPWANTSPWPVGFLWKTSDQSNGMGLDCVWLEMHGVGLESSRQVLVIRDGADKGGCCPAATQALGTCWDAEVLACSQIWPFSGSSNDSLSSTSWFALNIPGCCWS